jgi:hypothetical protein
MQTYIFLLAHDILMAQTVLGSDAPLPLAAIRNSWRQEEVTVVVLLAIGSLLLSYVPVIGWFFYPFRLLGTFIHEICHGLAAILTGGSFQHFVINQDRTGVALSRGGINWVVTSAGYLGCTVAGGLLLLAAASSLNAGEVLFWLGVGLALALPLLRNLFGMVAGILIAGALIGLGMNLSGEWAEWLLLFLSVQVMLNALQSLFVLIRISHMRALPSDAQRMREITGIPGIIWAALWTLVSIGLLLWVLMLAYGPYAITL